MNKVYLDGYNFIHRNPTLSRLSKGDLEHGREHIRSLLARYATVRKTQIIVVYDSRTKLPGEGTAYSGYLYREVFVRDADSYLRRVMRTEPDRKNVMVVSSDVEHVVQPAKAHGIAVMSSEEFMRVVRKTEQRDREQSEKPLPPTGREVDDWIRYFEEGEE